MLELDSPPARPRYRMSLDRAGLALGAGGVIGGMSVVALMVAGDGGIGPWVVGAFLIGSVLCALMIAGVAGPVWLLFHWLGWRGPVAAVVVGMLVAMAVFVGGQTYGFGLFDMPPTDGRTLSYRWISAVATSAILAFGGGAVALVMWRIAYRREG